IRGRAAELRRIGAQLAASFRDANVGSRRPALTLEDGTLAVTDNYLKVRIPPGRRRNERIAVLLTKSGEQLHGVPVEAESRQPEAGSWKLAAGGVRRSASASPASAPATSAASTR